MLEGPVALEKNEAVRLALRNNAFFLEQLAELGLTRADVIQAGLIANPDLTVTGPSASSVPASIGRAAFLAPEMRTSPSSGTPPRI